MKMRVQVLFRQLIVLTFLFLSAGLSAQSGKSLLWKISGNSLEEASYVFGTMHIICEQDFLIPDATKNALKSTGQLVLELDMDDPAMRTELQSLMMDMKGVDYKGKMSEVAYNKLDSLLTSQIGVGMQVGCMMKPFALMSLASLTLLECGEPIAYENVLMELAKEQDKEVLGLETGAFQMSIFDDIPQDEQISWIEDMLMDYATARAEFEEMTKVYLEQDIEQLYESFDDYQEYEKYKAPLLSDRNKDWVPKMTKMMKEKPTFFAVGAMHLGGDTGVIKLLQKAGFTVLPVENR